MGLERHLGGRIKVWAARSNFKFHLERLNRCQLDFWSLALRDEKEDAARSIAMLLETAPDFGYDSKLVIKWLVGHGLPQSTARNHTKELREQIDAKRDAKILELSARGLGKKAIATEVGCSPNTAQGVITSRGQNEPLAQTDPQATPIATPESADSTCDDDTDLMPWETGFSDEECDTTPAINPADAFQKALSEHEAERAEVNIVPTERPADIYKEVCLKSVAELERIVEEGARNERDAQISQDTWKDPTGALLLQWSLAFRDEKGGAEVNIVPTERPADIYKAVCLKSVAELERIVKEELKFKRPAQTLIDTWKDPTDAQLAQWWLDYGMTRKVTKRNCMSTSRI